MQRRNQCFCRQRAAGTAQVVDDHPTNFPQRVGAFTPLLCQVRGKQSTGIITLSARRFVA